MHHRRFRHRLRQLRGTVRHPHCKAQLQGIGKLDPFVNHAPVNDIRRSRKIIHPLRHKSLYCGIQLFKHFSINLKLRIIRHIDLTVLSDLGIRDRTICVSHTVHGSDLDDITHRPHHRIVSNLMKKTVVGINSRDDPTAFHEHIGPLVFGIIV